MAGSLIVALAFGVMASRGIAPAAGPEVSTVFKAGMDGYNAYRIPATLVTTNGTVLAFCEGRKNNRGDSGRIDMLLKRSTNGGNTWSAQQLIWADGDNTCGNPAPVVDQATGVIWLLMTWNLGADKESAIVRQTSRDNRRVYITHSSDDGVTWTKPEEITKSVKQTGWGWYATGPDNGIQLMHGAHKGRLVIPCNHTELDSAGQTPTRSHVIYSDDHGATWKIGGVEAEKTNESTIVELADGRLMQNMRSYHHKNRRAWATSDDDGLTWSPVKLDEALIEPVCQGSILRWTWPEAGEKSRILFSNPASLKRENLTVRVSYDEGATWPVSKVLFPGPSAYSSLTILPDKRVGCLFECGTTNSYENISLARIPRAWLENGN